jgi:hypothetical protein
MKKPRPLPAGPKNPCTRIPRTRKPFGSPAQGGFDGHGPHAGRSIETKHDDHPKEFVRVRNSRTSKRDARNRAVYFHQFNFMAHAADF